MRDNTPLAHYEVTEFPMSADAAVERNVPIVMRDGTVLRANVFRPQGEGDYPVILAMTPYGKDLSAASYDIDWDDFAAREVWIGSIHVSDQTSFESSDPAYWVPHGYAVAVVDVRGYHESGGRPGIFSKQDAADFVEVIRWAGTQAWSSGRVGLTGVSYLAISQWYVAAEQPEHLSAIVPWEGMSDPFADAIVHGGIPESRFGPFWFALMSKGARRLGLTLNPLSPWVARRFPNILRHAVAAPELSKITVPALVCASWTDQGLHSRGSFHGYETINSPSKWLYTHGRKKWSTFYDSEAVEHQRRFLDRFLKDDMNGIDDEPRVRIEVRHDLRNYDVRYEREWPIARTEYRRLHLDARRGHLGQGQNAEESAVEYDSRAAKGVGFRHTFAEDTEITGHSSLRLWVESPHAREMDLFVGLRKFGADGKEVHFESHDGYELGIAAMGWLRVSRRSLAADVTKPYRPVANVARRLPLRRGEIVPVDIEILPQSTFFTSGETLELTVSGEDIVANPFIGHDRTANKGTHVIHTGGRYDSYLTIPVIPAL